MRIPTLKKWQPILIKWVDSCHDSGWQAVKNLDLDDKWLDHETIGFYISSTNLAVTVAQSRSVADLDRANVDAVMTIPKAAITEIAKIGVQ